MTTKTRKYLPLGTVSRATMRPEDLIPAFLSALRTVDRERHDALRDAPGNADIFQWLEDSTGVPASGMPWEFVDHLCDILDEYCPPYCRFGAHPSDGADYGCWPEVEALEDAIRDGDVLKVGDTGEVPFTYLGLAAHVNDHGNLTLYEQKSFGKLTELWAIV